MFTRILKKDFKLVFGISHHVFSILLFALVQVVVASFAFKKLGFSDKELLQLTPGILILIFIFTGVVSLNTAFVPEKEGEALSGLLQTGIDSVLIYFSKFFVNFIFLFIVQLMISLLHSLLFNLNIFSYGYSLFAIFFLLIFGFVSLGTLFSAISVALPGRELILPLLLFPLLLPLVAAVVFLLQGLFSLGGIDFASFWFKLLCVYDIVAFMLSLVMFDFVIKD